jgi:hypothetical protein
VRTPLTRRTASDPAGPDTPPPVADDLYVRTIQPVRPPLLRSSVVLLCLVLLPAAAHGTESPASPVAGSETGPGTAPPSGPAAVFTHLQAIGLPVGGTPDPASTESLRGLCLAREMAGLTPSRRPLRPSEESALLALLAPVQAPKGSIPGLNVSITCQAGFYVENGLVQRSLRVTTGTRDGTPRGVFKVQRRTDGWRRSTLYPVMLYKPVNINGAIAVHGVPDPSMIRTIPSSRGCIRVPNRQMDWLFPRLQIGSKVRVYGRW